MKALLIHHVLLNKNSYKLKFFFPIKKGQIFMIWPFFLEAIIY